VKARIRDDAGGAIASFFRRLKHQDDTASGGPPAPELTAERGKDGRVSVVAAHMRLARYER
jgi:hypothetical protein